LKVLQGYNVDIITSFIGLAQRDVEELKPFYKTFGIDAAFNTDINYNFKNKKPKECYKSKVIYSDIGNFQFDYLRHEFDELNTKGNRYFDKTYAIIDEFDSILIDECNNTAMLAESVPGMNSLNNIIFFIWKLIENNNELIRIVG
jgi:preprotein translocase subunit SecA